MAEHWVANYFAARDRMDISVNISIGSSTQIALFVGPVLLLLSLRGRSVPDALRMSHSDPLLSPVPG